MLGLCVCVRAGQVLLYYGYTKDAKVAAMQADCGYLKVLAILVFYNKGIYG